MINIVEAPFEEKKIELWCLCCMHDVQMDQYAVKVRRHTPWSRGPLSWIPGMWFTLCQFRLSILIATAQSSHNSEIYDIGVHAQ